MIISHEKKFIYIATPKTGTSAIHTVWEGYKSIKTNPNPKSKHFVHANTDVAISAIEDANLNPKDYFIFSCARNPWDRCVSEYFFIYKRLKQNLYRGDLHEYRQLYLKFRHAYLNQKLQSFEQWVLEYEASSCFANHSTCQVDVIQPNLVSYIMRFENLQEDFITVCDKIGIPRQQLPYANKSKHKHYTEYYDDETREIVAKKYAKDIEYFGYEFGV